jgi:DNA invertase Pin-like site-specific DNA recombinase
MMTHAENLDPEPDILLVILQLVRLADPQFTPENALAVEQQVRTQYGGVRTRIPKRKKHPSPEQRRKIFQEALTDAPTEAILEGNGISRRTLYNYLKRGGE